MIAGKYDKFAELKDAQWTHDQIQKGTPPPELKLMAIDGGHSSFIVGDDMSWFEINSMDFIDRHQP